MEDLIIKYLNNDITEAELDKLLAWLESPENQSKFKTFTKLQYNLDDLSFPSSDAYSAVRQQIKTKKRKAKRTLFLKVAAISIFLLGIAGFSYFSFFQKSVPTDENWVKLELQDGRIKYIKPQEQNFSNKANRVTGVKHTLVYNDSVADKNQEIFYNTLSVPYGKTYSIVLSDGTKINLNSGSSLRYPTAFSPDSANRQVYLNGEAYFDVSHNKKQPFIVNTESLDIKVLGTRFDVSAYREDAHPFAVLVRGKIEAKDPIDQETLPVVPGQKVFYDQNKLTTKPVYLEKYTSWINGELVFINDPFEVIKHKLERKYDVKITNNYPALNDIRITARFSDANIDEVLETFKAYRNFKLTRKGRQIIIDRPQNK